MAGGRRDPGNEVAAQAIFNRMRLGRVRNKNIKMADERDPAERVRKLVQFAGQVEVDNSIAPKKYFRSGVEMERMVSISLYASAVLSSKRRNLNTLKSYIRYVQNDEYNI